MDIIRIIIADDHVIFRKGLRTVLNEISFVKVIAEASDGNELLRILKKEDTDIVLMDIRMPGMDGVEATKKLLEKHPDISVICLTMHEEIVILIK
jgi:two-component system response regulator DegU